jgi:hypothetical protein
MKAVLVTKSGDRLEVEAADKAGIILRMDTRKDPPIRAFRLVGPYDGGAPEFMEADVQYIDGDGLPDDVRMHIAQRYRVQPEIHVPHTEEV